MGLLFLGSTTSASNYSLVWNDEFTESTFDSGWTEVYNGGNAPAQSSWSIGSGKATRTATGRQTLSMLVRSINEKLSNGKIATTFIKDESRVTAPAVIARYTEGVGNEFYLMWLLYGNTGTGNVNMRLIRFTIGDNLASSGIFIGSFGMSNIND
ncbi:hypothetical protein FACS1894176_09350 [Bacteroidia bacterium]|nr:hypothetical protein FACS1894176_09350 [Bacteroidia bacterium]